MNQSPFRTLARFGLFALALSTAAGRAEAQAPAGPTLAKVRAAGILHCSASLGTAGFGLYDSKGVFQGLDADTCRAVAAAVLGEPKVQFTPLSTPQRLTALQTGQVDIVVQTLTWTQSREAANGLVFAGVNFYDGQSFLTRVAPNVKVGKDLAGASFCTTQGSTSELNLADWARANNVQYRPVIFERNVDGMEAYKSGRCDVYSTDASQLAANRSTFNNPAEHQVLPDRISKEPLGPAVRKGDEQWFEIVRWTLFALIAAEELGVTQANVDEMLKSPSPNVQRLLGVAGDHGKLMGLDNKWAYNAIKAVGNYGEIYDRHFGPKTAINLPRGRNALWTDGGLMYAPPIR